MAAGIQGTVKGVLGTDCVQVINRDTGDEEQVLLASINVPRLARRDDAKSERYAFEAREYMRLLLVGKDIKAEVINETGGRKYCDVVLDDGEFKGFSVNEALVREGYASVHKAASKQTASYFQRIVLAETEAKDAERNLNSLESKEENGEIRNIYNNVDVTTEFLEHHQGLPVQAIVDGINSPTLFRLLFPSTKRGKPHLVIQCNLMGLSSNIAQYPELDDFTETAKNHLERTLYQRDVRFLPLAVNRANGQLSGILYTGKDQNLNYELAKRGWVKVVENAIRDELALQSLYDAQTEAQDQQNGIFESFTTTEQNAIETFEGTVVEVVNGECLLVSEHDTKTPFEEGTVHRIYLASIRAPRLGSAAREADPLAEEARDCLSKLVQDQRVRVRVELLKPTPEALLKANITGPGAIGPEMRCGSVFVGNKNVACELLSKGLVSVPYLSANVANEKGFDHSIYLKKESEAKVANLGRHKATTPPPPPRMADLTGKEASFQKSKQYETMISKNKKLEGTVVFVYNPGRFKVRFNSEKLIANVVISNLQVAQGPRPAMRGMPARDADPCADVALIYAKARLLNKTVRVSIVQTDKGGNFLAQVHLGNEKFGDTLIQKGFATIAMEHRAEASQMSLQESAMEKKAGMWANDAFRQAAMDAVAEVEAQVSSPEELTPPIVLPAISVVHVNSVSDFFVSEDTDRANQALDRLQQQIQTYAGQHANSAGNLDVKNNANVLAIFSDDGCWYRARVMRADRRAKKASVLFIDFGNAQEVSFNAMLPMPSQLDTRTIAPCATQYRLAGVMDKKDFMDEAATTLFNLTQSPPYSATVYPSPGNQFPLLLIHDNESKQSINAKLLETGCAVLSRRRTPANMEADEMAALKDASQHASRTNTGIYRFVMGQVASDDSDYA